MYSTFYLCYELRNHLSKYAGSEFDPLTPQTTDKYNKDDDDNYNMGAL